MSRLKLEDLVVASLATSGMPQTVTAATVWNPMTICFTCPPLSYDRAEA
jgi:hypothetical protein